MSFYVTLPSNVSNSHANNTTAQFITEFPKTITLDDLQQWSVGLAEVSLPFSWNNISGKVGSMNQGDGWLRIKSDSFADEKDKQKTKVKVFIPAGYYPTITDLISAMQKLTDHRIARAFSGIPPGHIPSVQFGWTAGRITIETKRLVNVIFSPKLTYIMGFTASEGVMVTRGDNMIVARFPPDISGGFNTIYIYCNIVKPQIVGNTCVPLLRTVTVDVSNLNYGQPFTQIFHNPHYVGLSRGQIESMEIKLMSDQDKLIDFSFGSSILKLHFVKRPKILGQVE